MPGRGVALLKALEAKAKQETSQITEEISNTIAQSCKIQEVKTGFLKIFMFKN